MDNERILDKLRKAKVMEADIMTGAPLIICPSNGSQISKKMKKVLKRFKEENKIDVKLCERGGSNIAKSDPLKSPTCSKKDCFHCSAEGGGIAWELCCLCAEIIVNFKTYIYSDQTF